MKIYASPKKIGYVSQDSSCWFEGYNEKYFHDKGALYYCISNKYSKLLCLQFLLRKRKKVCENIDIIRAYKLMVSGINIDINESNKMNENLKVSTIITTYRRADMLKRAIDSVLNQTYSNIEVIVVDDNDEKSEDRKNTEEIMTSYANNPKVKYIKHKGNMNGAAARNTGIKNSTGEIVCFLDDDDWYLETKIEKQLEFLCKNKDYKAVYCGWHRNGKIVIPKRKGNLGFELLSGDSLIYTNTIMMWKNIAEKIGGWDERFRRNQEAAFLLRYFKYGFSIGVIEECLVEFDTSDRRNQLDSEKNEEQFEFYLREHEDMIKKLADFDKNARKKIYSKRYRGVLLYHLKSKNIINAFKVYIKMIKYIPIMFNKDIIVYICYRLINKDICNY